MLPTIIRTPPSSESYVPLEEHQAQTPTAFFDGKPVLHYLSRGATVKIPRERCGTLPFFGADLAGGKEQEGENEDEDGGEEAYKPWDMVERKADVFVNSENLVVFCPETESGVEIPYPAIAMHGIQSAGTGNDKRRVVWLQLELWDTAGGEEFGDAIDMTILPALPPSTNPDAATTPETTATATAPPSDPASVRVQEMYAALTACADLHPDPVDENDEDDFDRIIFENGGSRIDGLPGAWELGANAGDGEVLALPPPMPGSSGWITADNVNEYFDGEGNWIGDEDGKEEEGGAVGHVRNREEMERDEVGERVEGGRVNGHSDETESKKPRIE